MKVSANANASATVAMTVAGCILWAPSGFAATPAIDGVRAAPTEAPATFAQLIASAPRSTPRVAPLQYADDDAARYLDLAHPRAGRYYLLTRDQREHQVDCARYGGQKRRRPLADELRRAVDALARDLAQARARGVRTVLYIARAGHRSAARRAQDHHAPRRPRRPLAPSCTMSIDAGQRRPEPPVDRRLSNLPPGDVTPAPAEGRGLRGFLELAAAIRAGRVRLCTGQLDVGREARVEPAFVRHPRTLGCSSGLYRRTDADGDEPSLRRDRKQ